jgi:HEAT repeat protein
MRSLLERYRQGQGSPAWRRYVKAQLLGMLESTSPEVLWTMVENESDPEVLELAASLWVERYDLTQDPAVLERVVARMGEESDPARRAALVRSLRATDEASCELLLREERTRDTYQNLVKDPSPEVRQAVVDNLTAEAARNGGWHRTVAEQAVALAAATEDPHTAAKLLGSSPLGTARLPAISTARRMLQSSESPEVRAAAARALGTVPMRELPKTMQALSERFATEPDMGVRSAILESISRLGLSQATPILQKLKGTDARMDGEIDLWLGLLATQPQTWNMLHQEKLALEQRLSSKG